ncbi:hypothetical protein JCM1840_007450 [Sporobolomyces johnsonii]
MPTPPEDSPPAPSDLRYPLPDALAILENDDSNNPASLTLDEQSWAHVERLCEQSLRSCKVAEGTWKDALMGAVHALEELITPELLVKLSTSKIALANAAIEIDEAREPPGPGGEGGGGVERHTAQRILLGGWWKAAGTGKGSDAIEGAEADEREKERRRTLWRNAAMLLPTDDDDEHTSHVYDVSTISSARSIDAWLSLDDLPKIAVLSLLVKSTETTMGAVKSGASTLGVSFSPDEWEGEGLFGRGGPDLDDDDLKLVERYGGMFRLTSTPKDLPKLKRILELLAFAVLSLKLESHLLRDISCPRPPPPSEPSSPDVDADPEVVADTSGALDPSLFLPGAFHDDFASFPSEEWRLRKSWRTNWSSLGVKSWMQLISPRPDLPPPNILRRSTRSSLSRAFSAPRTSRSSAPPSTTTPSSPTPSTSNSPRHKVRDKLRGFGDQLRRRKRRSKGTSLERERPGVSDTEAETATDEEKNWDFLGLGLNFGGLGLSGLGSLRSTDSREDDERKKSPASTTGMEVEEEKQPALRFEKVIHDLSQFALSISPDVLYPPPHLLFRLRQQELAAAAEPEPELFIPPSPSPASRIKPHPLLSPDPPFPSALQRAHAFVSTHSLALDFAGGVTGETASRYAPSERETSNPSTATRITLDVKAGLASLMTNNSSLGGTMRHQAMQFLVQTVRNDAPPGTLPCEAPRWLKFNYYENRAAGDPDHFVAEDTTLEAFVERLVHRQHLRCSSCGKPNRDHSLVLMHQNERLEVSLASLPDPHPGLDHDPSLHSATPQIAFWQTCKTCQSMTPPKRLSIAAASYSFAKFAELLLYDVNLIPLPDLCEHASEDRCALVRSFLIGRTVVEIRVGMITLFELRLPTAVDPDVEPDDEFDLIATDVVSTESLREEIVSFFGSVYSRVDALEDRLAPPPPSPKLASTEEPALSDAGPSTELRRHARSDSEQTIIDNGANLVGTEKAKEKDPLDDDSFPELALLRNLRRIVRNDEEDCLAVAEDIAPQQLNNGRFFFESKAKTLKLRLAAWEKKHADALAAGSGPELPSEAEFVEPDYFADGVHAFPVDSAVLVRDDELSSLIALTLSAASFQDELAAPSATPSRRVTPSSLQGMGIPSRRPSAARNPIPSEFLDPSTASISPSSSVPSTPPRSVRSVRAEPADPDDPDADFAPPEEIEFLAKARKNPTRSGTGSMFRNLVRKRSTTEVDSLHSTPAVTPTLESGPFGVGGEIAKWTSSRVPPRPLPDSVLDDILKTRESASTPRTQDSRQGRAVPSIIAGLSNRREGSTATTPSLIHAVADPTRSTISSQSATGTIKSIASSHSASSDAASTSSSLSSSIEESDQDELDQLPPLAWPQPLGGGGGGSRLFGTKLDGFLAGWDSLRSKAGGLSPRLGPTADPGGSSNEHVKFKFSRGCKKYRVTAYYPRRFQALRAKCGLSESLFVESLSRCTDLNPSGGKSSAAFLMTGDRRFMLKELVTKFGYSELESLLTFAPRLLDYLMRPERPSLLAKIYGIYTVKTQDSKTGEKKKVDLIVMEHLFHSQTISRQFDLKGIASRVAKPKPGSDAKEGTGWDGDWLTGSLRDQLLIYPHSRTLLLDALSNDVEFLSSNGGIDFSLLVGVDDSRSTLVVGLIDTLGVFNTLKVLEHQAKTAVKLALASDSSSVTVLPPSEYAKRFLSAMERYFVAVPDKWSKPPGCDGVDPDPRLACPL